MFQNIRDVILANRFYVVRTTSIKFSQESARTFYQEHKNKFFYHRLVSFMTSEGISKLIKVINPGLSCVTIMQHPVCLIGSGSVDVHILARKDAVAAWRVLMGPTKVYQAQFSDPNTIRGSYGISDTRNAIHGSDRDQTKNDGETVTEAALAIDNWEEVTPDLAISYVDFISMDEDVAVCGEVTDADIVAEVLNNNIQAEDEPSGDEEDNSSVVHERPIPSAAEAMDHIQELGGGHNAAQERPSCGSFHIAK
uniref:Nucleoside diphosphate kinase-like domain-containing protein n=1 Tax=Timema poppense TaxID=170557 RepID=A0A7R9CX62_TIMPO|nr:unnamed protein product [Timema poppensis]